jgi:hypothetical protein
MSEVAANKKNKAKQWITHNSVMNSLRNLVKQNPRFARLSSLGQTSEGRDIPLIEIGAEPDRVRPAVCITGGLHALENIGTAVAVNVAAELIKVCGGESGIADKLWRGTRNTASETLYYVVPQVSPDGMDAAATGIAHSRSVPRTSAAKGASYWRRSDLDGDGYIRQMRIPHPGGEFAIHPAYSDVLIPRAIDSVGPFYKVFPEGVIENFDGRTIPGPDAIEAGHIDFNRNFPFGWNGSSRFSGAYPGVERETRAILEFASRNPHIFAWIDVHSFGGVLLRPPFANTQAIEEIDAHAYEAIGVVAEQVTGLPMLSAIEHMTPDASQPMGGTLAAWAHHDRGCVALVAELWDVFVAAGVEKKRPFHKTYNVQDKSNFDRLVEWDLKENGANTFGSWTVIEHPQLGSVEVGGIDSMRGWFNPPDRYMSQITDELTSLVTALTAFQPIIDTSVKIDRLDKGLHRIDLRACNSGYLSTAIMSSIRTANWNTGIEVAFRTIGCKLISGQHRFLIGHLRGWGRGIESELNAPFFQKSAGFARSLAEWIVEGAGSVEIELSSPRMGRHLSRYDIP